MSGCLATNQPFLKKAFSLVWFQSFYYKQEDFLGFDNNAEIAFISAWEKILCPRCSLMGHTGHLAVSERDFTPIACGSRVWGFFIIFFFLLFLLLSRLFLLVGLFFSFSVKTKWAVSIIAGKSLETQQWHPYFPFLVLMLCNPVLLSCIFLCLF